MPDARDWTTFKNYFSNIKAFLKDQTHAPLFNLDNAYQKMFNKQGITYNTSEEMFDILRNGKFTADPETIAQAKEDKESGR